MPQIYDMGPKALLPLRRKACWGFFRPKNPTASAGFEPANLGTKGQHATSRPTKSSFIRFPYIFWYEKYYATQNQNLQFIITQNYFITDIFTVHKKILVRDH